MAVEEWEKVIKAHGFKDEAEFNHLVASVPFAGADFLKWRNEDGTKTGLLKLIEKQKEQGNG